MSKYLVHTKDHKDLYVHIMPNGVIGLEVYDAAIYGDRAFVELSQTGTLVLINKLYAALGDIDGNRNH